MTDYEAVIKELTSEVMREKILATSALTVVGRILSIKVANYTLKELIELAIKGNRLAVVAEDQSLPDLPDGEKLEVIVDDADEGSVLIGASKNDCAYRGYIYSQQDMLNSHWIKEEVDGTER